MNCIYYSVLNVVSVTLVLSVPTNYASGQLNANDLTELIQCEDRCERQFSRVCLEPPKVCGSCLDGFLEISSRDGEKLCLKQEAKREHKNIPLPDDLIDRLSTKAEQQRQQADTYTSDSQSVELDKPEVREDRGQSQTSPPDSNSNQSAIAGYADPQVAAAPSTEFTLSDPVFVAVVAGCSVAGLVGLIVAGVCWYKLQQNVKATSEKDYDAYVTGPTKERVQSPGDRKLAQSAQMYHYQHQKQQMIAMEKANGEMKNEGSDVDSEEENEEGDYTVYECPGLAPTGEMEVKNPLFTDDTPTPGGDRSLPK